LYDLISDVRISDRLDEVDKWRKILEYSIQDIDREIQAIQSAKEQCERYLEHMRSPLGILSLLYYPRPKKQTNLSDVSLENYATRDGRKAIDNVDDEAERELKKVDHSLTLIINCSIIIQEVYVIDGIKRQLHQQVQSTFDQIARLTEAKQQLIRVNIIFYS
jgi:hypothetical protein